MGVQLLSIEGSQVKMEVTIELSRSMLTSEENIQHSLNEVGCMATVAALKYLDTDGSAIEIAGSVMRTKGEQPKAYQTPMVKPWFIAMSINVQEGVKPIVPWSEKPELSSPPPPCLQNRYPQNWLMVLLATCNET
jgi:hypothetical protein